MRYVDPTGHTAWDYWRGFAAGFAEGAVSQTGKIAVATGTALVAAVTETPKVIADAAVLGFEATTGVRTGVGLFSAVGETSAARMARGESAADITQDTAVGILKAVSNAQVVEEQLKAFADYRTGRASLAEFEDRMAGAAGSGLATAALARGAQKWYQAAKASVVAESATQAPFHEPVANITPEASALADLASAVPDGSYGIGNSLPAVTGAGSVASTGGGFAGLRQTARFLQERGVTDPMVRRQMIEAGFEGSIGADTPYSLGRFDKLFARPLRTGRGYTGRLGNIETRVTTVDTAIEIEKAGLQPRFEYQAGGRFVDVVGVDPQTGQPVRAVQIVKILSETGEVNPREIPAKLDIQRSLKLPVQYRVSGSQ